MDDHLINNVVNEFRSYKLTRKQSEFTKGITIRKIEDWYPDLKSILKCIGNFPNIKNKTILLLRLYAFIWKHKIFILRMKYIEFSGR